MPTLWTFLIRLVGIDFAKVNIQHLKHTTPELCRKLGFHDRLMSKQHFFSGFGFLCPCRLRSCESSTLPSWLPHQASILSRTLSLLLVGGGGGARQSLAERWSTNSVQEWPFLSLKTFMVVILRRHIHTFRLPFQVPIVFRENDVWLPCLYRSLL